jgi:hypothetical protein
MKNLHVIATDKPSRLGNFQHIYITDNSEIKEGDWFYLPRTNSVHKCIENSTKVNLERRLGVAKVILTTDQDLVADGVQPIDDTFLQWFVKNTTCEEVKTEEVYPSTCCIQKEGKTKMNNGCMERNRCLNYKIIIPQEEPKQTDEKGNALTYWGGLEEPKQDTLEEVYGMAARLCEHLDEKEQAMFIAGFIECNKWQAERMYSEEDLKNAWTDGRNGIKNIGNPPFNLTVFKNKTFKEWFSQLKKNKDVK